MRYLLACLLTLFLVTNLNAQLDDGSVAPNWDLTDLNGNNHELYDYLDAGKDAIIDFSVTWCPPCWSYHNSGILNDLYDDLGPSGSDELMVFFIEGNGNSNDACLYGEINNCSDITLGNWVTGVDYPIFNLYGDDLSVVANYNLGFWPTLYAINAEHHTVWLVGQASYNGWENLITRSFTLDANYSVSPGECEIGEIDIDATGGWGTLSYSWSNGESGSTVEVESGTYNVTIKDGNDYFIVVQDIEIQNDGSQFHVNYEDVILPKCNGSDDGSIYVDVDSNDDIEYTWSNGEDDQYNTNLESGDYTLTIYNNTNDCSLVLEYEVDDPEELELSASLVNTSCGQNNGIIEVSTSGGSGLYYYDFGNGYSTEDELIGASSGTYLIYVEDENECLTWIEVVLTPSMELRGSVIGNLELDCAVTETIVTVESNTSNSIDYQWYSEYGELIETESSATISIAGSYIINMVDSEGCSATIPFTVVDNTNAPEVQINGIRFLDCQTPSINVSVLNEAMNFDVVWSYTDENGENMEVLTDEINIVFPGDYSVLVTDTTNGCQSFEHFTIGIIENEPISSFEYGVDVDTVIVSSTSLGNNLTEVWTLDGVEVNLSEEGTFAFEENGSYVICLYISNECGSSNHCETVDLSEIISNVGDFGLNGLEMHYNGQQLVIDNHIHAISQAQVSIFDLEGKLILQNKLKLISGIQFFEISQLNQDIYLVHLDFKLGEKVIKIFTTL